ncbi:MAG: DUF3783 domain-containing protein [Syntrophobacteraceae bacterium]
MEDQSKLLVWNYTAEEKKALDALLREIGAPPAESIDPTCAHLSLREIIAGTGTAGDGFPSDEKVILFHAVPDKGVRFLMQVFRETKLPKPIYAVVTEHSIGWPFRELLEHLVEERNRMERRGG